MYKTYSNSYLPDRTITINLDHLVHNVSMVQKITKNRDIIAFVKADAYGHGIVETVQALLAHGIDTFAVASPLELMQLRHVYPKIHIVVCSSYLCAQHLAVIAEYRGDVVLFDPEHITLLEKAVFKHPIRVWFKINIGMNRMGFPLERFKSYLTRVQSCQNVQHKQTMLMGHLSCADQVDSIEVREQIRRFLKATASIPLRKTMSNSAAILNYPESYCDVVRPGLLMYGVAVVKQRAIWQGFFKPVMQVCSRVVAVNDCARGDSVGYDATWRATCQSRIAIVAMGYADGYPLSGSNRCQVVINSRRYPVVGKVSMDTLAIDITNAPEPIVLGQLVELWGSHMPVYEVAQAANTSPYELLTRVSGRRARYVYVGCNVATSVGSVEPV